MIKAVDVKELPRLIRVRGFVSVRIRRSCEVMFERRNARTVYVCNNSTEAKC